MTGLIMTRKRSDIWPWQRTYHNVLTLLKDTNKIEYVQIYTYWTSCQLEQPPGCPGNYKFLTNFRSFLKSWRFKFPRTNNWEESTPSLWWIVGDQVWMLQAWNTLAELQNCPYSLISVNTVTCSYLWEKHLVLAKVLFFRCTCTGSCWNCQNLAKQNKITPTPSLSNNPMYFQGQSAVKEFPGAAMRLWAVHNMEYWKPGLFLS